MHSDMKQQLAANPHNRGANKYLTFLAQKRTKSINQNN